MKYWVSKYALTEGIYEVEAGPPSENGFIFITVFSWYKLGEHAHETKEAACQAAEIMRQKQIQSLKKQLAKLEDMRFCSGKDQGE